MHSKTDANRRQYKTGWHFRWVHGRDALTTKGLKYILGPPIGWEIHLVLLEPKLCCYGNHARRKSK